VHCLLQQQLDGAHTHYQQLLDQLVPAWRHDTSGLETANNTATATQQQQQQIQAHAGAVPGSMRTSLSRASDNGSITNAPAPAPGPAAAAPQGSTRRISSGGFAGAAASDAQLASLNSQLAATRKEARALQQQLAGLQAEHGQLGEHAAAREAALTGEVRRVAARAAEAARAAADDKAVLLGQVRSFGGCGVAIAQHVQLLTLPDAVFCCDGWQVNKCLVYMKGSALLHALHVTSASATTAAAAADAA
jgi:hypothetical protein